MKRVFLPLFLFICTFGSGLTQSILPELNELERGAILNPKKYSTAQYEEITSSLKKIDYKTRVVTYNLLFDLFDENLALENRWPQRLPRIKQLIDALQPDILCIQELQSHQVKQLIEKIGKEFEFFLDKNCLKTSGLFDFDGIFYRRERFTLLEGRSWKISHLKKDTLVTMAQFLDLKTNKKIRVFNAHFPFSNADEREKTAIEIAALIKPYAENEAVILGGDFNTFENRPDLEKLPFLDGDRIECLLSRGKIENSLKKAILGHLGPISSFTNTVEGKAAFEGLGTPGIILDHLFVSSTITVLLHGIESALVDNHYPSDHLPVLIDILY